MTPTFLRSSITKPKNIMKERPILFSTPMVQAILDDLKTQTRRVVKCNRRMKFQSLSHPVLSNENLKAHFYNGFFECTTTPEQEHQYVKFPYGKPGDILWVRETFTQFSPDHIYDNQEFAYKANSSLESEELRLDFIQRGYPYQWKPSIHMPKSAARIWLEITDVRVQRLRDINDEDAKAEGIARYVDRFDNRERFKDYQSDAYGHPHHDYRSVAFPITSFATLWDSINGEGKNWSANPWVWAITFKVISTNGKPRNK